MHLRRSRMARILLFHSVVCLIVSLLLVETQSLPIDANNIVNDERTGNRIEDGLSTLLKYPGTFFNDFLKTLTGGLDRFRGFIKPDQNNNRNKRSIAVEDLARMIDNGRDEIQSIASQFENPVDGIHNNVQDVGEFIRELLT